MKPDGFLLLGRSESITGFGQFFSPADKAHRIFSRAAGPSIIRFAPVTEALKDFAPTTPERSGAASPATLTLTKEVDNLLLSRYAPAGVVVNDRLEILQFRGRTGAYLEPAPGQPQHSLPAMAKEGLLTDLRIAFRQAKKQMKPIRRGGIQIHENGHVRHCVIVVIPLAEPNERLFAVLFEEESPEHVPSSKPGKETPGERRRVARMELELAATKEYQRSLVEEHERMNDDLTAANEELVSSNEELQSLNEEMETAKEELQSSNEELTTVNDEMQNRNQELNVVNSDLVNLLASVDIPIIIVDAERHIRQFTPKARGIMNVLPTDCGRTHRGHQAERRCA